MLSAQHSEPANVMSTTSGDANPANATTRSSTVAAEADGATMLVPNAMVRAEPTTPRASPPASSLSAIMSLPSPAHYAASCPGGCVRPCLLAPGHFLLM